MTLLSSSNAISDYTTFVHVNCNSICFQLQTNSLEVMLYESELVRHNTRSWQQLGGGGSGLQQFFHYEDSNIWNANRYSRVLREFMCKRCRIDGLPYMYEHPVIVRFFWAAVLVVALSGSFIMFIPLMERHMDQQLETVVETSQHPIYKIKFPAIGVCPRYGVNWSRQKAAEDRFLPTNASTIERTAFQNLLISLEQLSCYSYDQLSYVMSNRKNLQLLGNVSITELGRFMAFRCDELFSECIFDETTYDCCKLFVAEPTEEGICMVFNSLMTEESRNKQLMDPAYPWMLSKAGEHSGLRFTIRYNESYYREKVKHFSMKLMIKETTQWSESIMHPLYVNTNNFVSITPQVTEVAKGTHSLQPEKRRCLFNTEYPKKFRDEKVLPYNRHNCLVACLQSHLRIVCNCTFSYFFPFTVDPNVRECQAMDFVCLFDNRDIFSFIEYPDQDKFIKDTRRGLTCDCLENCYSLVYLLSVNSIMMPDKYHNRSTPLIKADIYYGQRVMTKYLTKLQYSAVDLMATFGGTFALFIGASILTVAEILQFVVRLTFMLMSDRRCIWRREKT